jgi:putative cardiolipin synthase
MLEKIAKTTLLLMLGAAPAFALIPPTRAYPKGAYAATTEPQELQYIESGMAAFEKRLELIESAQQSIDIEYYLFQTDSAGRLFTQALMRKADQEAAAGHREFQIRILIDRSFVSHNLNDYEATVLSRHGIKVRYYNAKTSFNLKKDNQRNHKKLLLIDGGTSQGVGLMGGRNMGAGFYSLSSDNINFVDRDVVVRGSITQDMRQSFEIFWNSSLATPSQKMQPPNIQDYGFESEREARERQMDSSVDRDHYRAYLRALRTYQKEMTRALTLEEPTPDDQKNLARIRSLGPAALAQEATGTCPETYFLSDLPGYGPNKHVIYNEVKNFIAHTQHELLIETPFLVVEHGDTTLADAARRGVSVNILTNSLHSSDQAAVEVVLYRRLHLLTEPGAQLSVFLGEPPANQIFSAPAAGDNPWEIHGKSAVYDDDTSMVGSFNFDPRSENVNSEMVLICKGNRDLAQSVKAGITQTLSQSVLLDKNGDPVSGEPRYFHVSLGKRLAYYLLYPFAGLFDFWL